MTSVFQQEHNNFKKELIYNRAFLRPELVKSAKIVEGFLFKMQRASDGVLNQTGLIDDGVQVGQEEQQAYEAWLEESIQITGKLEIPPDLASILGRQMTKKFSRVSEMLTSIPPKPEPVEPKKK